MRQVSVAALVAALLLVAGCTSSPGAGPSERPTTTVDSSSLVPADPPVDGTWLVTHIFGNPVVPGTTPSISFADGQVSGNTTCNSWSGTFTQPEGNWVEITLGAMTAMGCADPAAQHQEGAFIAALGVVHNVYRSESGNGLDLSDGRTGVVLTLIPAPVTADLPLEGTTWTLDSLISAPAGAGQPGSVSSTTFGTPPVTITISGGALSGKACNSFGGTVTLSADNRIHVSQLESTAMACGDDEMTQEATVFATLAAIETYTIAGARLLLMAPDGTGLGFTGA